MQINENYLVNFLPFILLSISSIGLARKQELISIDGTNFKIYANSLSNKLRPPNPLNNECLPTVGVNTSWILFDLGFLVSGIVQLRLFAEQFSENAHLYLSNVQIKMAYTFPLKTISNFAQYEKTYFKLCGTTGTVFPGTLNAVVDCKSSIDARWILVKNEKTLNLCNINVMQNTVKPKCFYRINLHNELFPNISSNLDVFKSMRHTTSLECFQKCFGETACQGIAFNPYETDTGICQFLKKKASNSGFTCEPPCWVSLNICHLGQIIRMGSIHEDSILKVPSIIANSYALSVEINGNITCNENNCGETILYISDSNEKLHLCGRINPLLYDVLIKEVFICENVVKDPLEIIIKTSSTNLQYSYKFKSINLRIADENSFDHEALSYIRNSLVTSSTKFLTTFSTTVISRLTTKKSTVLSTKSSTSLSSSSKIADSHSQNQNEKIDRIKFINVTPLNSISFEKSKIKLSVNSSLTSEFQSVTDQTKLFIRNSMVTSKRNFEPEQSLNVMNSKKLLNDDNRKVSSINWKKEINSTIIFRKMINSNKETKISSTSSSTKFQSVHNNSNTPPYIWIILVTFAIILILVTIIVLLVTFLDGQRKKKEWDIPEHGLFPLDQISEQMTLQSSLLDSTIRKNNL